MNEIEAWGVCPVMATCKRRPGVWWRGSKGPCVPHLGLELRILSKVSPQTYSNLSLIQGPN